MYQLEHTDAPTGKMLYREYYVPKNVTGEIGDDKNRRHYLLLLFISFHQLTGRGQLRMAIIRSEYNNIILLLLF